MGEVIREHRLAPDVILSSDALRARQTAEAAAKAAHYAGEILLDPRLYGATPADIVGVLRTVDETKAATVIVVGHNPGLEELVARLTRGRQDLPTASLAQIVLPVARWRDLTLSSRGSLMGLWRPKELI
jgi:phosphohistidine phosphatase